MNLIPIDIKCGYCLQQTTAFFANYSPVLSNKDDLSISLETGKDIHYQGIVQCMHCTNRTFIDFIYNSQIPINEQIKSINNCIKIIAVYPEYPEPKAPKELPETITKSYMESQMAFNATAYELSVIGARKTLELICQHFCQKHDTLKEMINSMLKEGIIIKSISDWANLLRLFGNKAAHENKEITKQEAKEIMDFTQLLIDFLFVIPAKIKTLQKQ